MLLSTPRVDQNVVDEHHNEPIKVLHEHTYHHLHEHSRSIGQPKWYDHELKMTILGSRYGLWDVLRTNLQLVVP